MLIKSMKGQSAMEYLMTYGWALLVIVIVIAVLMFIRPFGAPETCLFQQPGFSCEGHRMNDQGVLFAKFVNGQQKSIKDVKVACVMGSERPASTFGWTTVTGVVEHGSALGNLFAKGISCRNPDGGAITVATGDDFSGRVYIQYKYSDDPSESTFPSKTVYANVIAPVQ